MSQHVVTIDEDAPLPESVTSEAIASLVQHVLDQEGIGDDWEIGIQFIDDAAMQQAHVEFMGIDEPTDIMTFPYADDDDGSWGGEDAGGDLLISVDRAAANAVDANWSHADELFFVIAHGLLHLTGWDDGTDDDREAMLKRQHDLIASWADRL